MNLSGMSAETFAALLTPCLPSVRRLVQSRLRVWDEAEDVLQQTLLQAFRHRDQLQAHSKFKSWLWSIAMNEICMFHRRVRRHAPLPESPGMECRDRAPSPFERFEQLERRRRIQNAIATLSEGDRTAIRLRDLEGLSMPDTAKAMRRSEPAAKSVHFRARKRLKLALSGG
jgi:RNA polymerase sigma-70 factor, ECF subfamily